MKAELTIEIARPPEEVFSYLTHVSNLPAWQSGVRSTELVDDGEPHEGSRFRETRVLLGKELKTTFEITQHEPPRLFSLHALDGPAPFDVSHDLADEDGRTRLHVVVEGDPAFLPGFASGIAARRLEKQVRKDFERLKTLLES